MSADELEPRESYVQPDGIRVNFRNLLIWGTNPEFFKRDMPKKLQEIATIPDPSFIEDVQAANTMKTIKKTVAEFLEKAPDVIMGNIYGNWARSNGYIEKVNTSGMELYLPIPLNKLNELQGREWEVFTMMGEVHRGVALDITRQLIYMFHQPDVRYIPDESLHYLSDDLEKARKQLVASIFPDLTDEDAKILFGQLTTAEEILKESNDQSPGKVVEERSNTQETKYAMIRDYERYLKDPKSLGINIQQLNSRMERLDQVSDLMTNGGWRRVESTITEFIEQLKIQEKPDLEVASFLFACRARARFFMDAYDHARWDYKKAIELYQDLDGDLKVLARLEFELASLEEISRLPDDAAKHFELFEKHWAVAEKTSEIS